MKPRYALIVALVMFFGLGAATCGPSDPVPVGNPAGVGELIFQDNFDVDGAPNSSNWSPSWFGTVNGYSQPINSAESGCYHTSQANVSGGALHLTTAATSSSDCRLRNGSVASTMGGIVSSYGKREFRYGYFEAVAKMDSASNWPAWWTNGHHNSWPDAGELDVMELLSCRCPTWHVHYPGFDTSGSKAFSAGYHTYAMKWTPDTVEFFYDGVKLGSTTNVSIPHDHYLVLNHGVRSSYTNGNVQGQTYDIDYVRVWALA